MANNSKVSRPQSIHSWVIQELGTRIVTGVYAEGEYIPNEASICEELGVSRTALREAFKGLTAKGLLESRPKLGTRVRPKKYWNMFDSAILSWSFAPKPTRKFLGSLFEMREIIEPNAAVLAARHATDKQITAIEQAYFAMERAETEEEVITSDTNFHMAILDATDNEFMISLGDSIKSALAGLFRISSKKKSEFKNSLPGHKAVFLGIRDRDEERARFEMQALLSKTIPVAMKVLREDKNNVNMME